MVHNTLVPRVCKEGRQLRTLVAAVASRDSLQRCAFAGAKIAAVSASDDACADNALLL